jgi:hypothetical protein
MTVAELIAKLQEMPQEARVVLDNHYDGFNDVDDVETVEIMIGEPLPRGIGGTHSQWGRYIKKPPDETAVAIH